MAVFLGLLAALGIGLSDLFGRRVMNASSSITAATAMQLVSGAAGAVVAVATVSVFEFEAFAWGCVSGLGMAAGLNLYYGGIQRSSSTLVAPIVASMTALLPFAFAVVRGSVSSILAVSGAVVAVIGLVLVTGGAVSRRRLAAGVRYGVVSGLAYAAATIAFIMAADAEGWWPVVGQRIFGGAALITVAVRSGERTWPPTGQRLNGVTSGLLTAGVSIALLAGLALDPGPTSVAMSTFPVFSVMIGRWFFADPLQRVQMVGIALVVTGIAAISVG